MKKVFFILLAIVILIITFLVWKSKSTGAAAEGTAEIGDECNTHAEDESHICSEGLICIPQNEDSEGNGKCGYDLTPSPTAGASATPTIEPTAVPTPTPSGTPSPTPFQVVPTGIPATPNMGIDTGCAVRDCSTHDAYPNSSFDGKPVGWK